MSRIRDPAGKREGEGPKIRAMLQAKEQERLKKRKLPASVLMHPDKVSTSFLRRGADI